MIPTSFQYVRAKTLNDALKALGKNTKVIAGGHSLLPLLKFRLAQPGMLIDIGQLPQLKGIKKAGAGGGIKIGAATTYRELLESKELTALYPLIAEVTEHIGDLQVRNAGTIGGGLVHADPAADMPPVMLVLDATFVLEAKGGKRSVPARKFFKGPFTTALKPNELLTEIQLPAPPQGAGMAYASFEQAASGYALAGAAALIAIANGMITRADLAFTGLADTPFLAPAAAKLVGTQGAAELIAQVAAAAVAGVEANDDIHASAEYRLHLATVAARRALTQAIARAQ